MSELQLGLMGAGIVILLGLIVYNAIQRVQLRRMMPLDLTEVKQGADLAPQDASVSETQHGLDAQREPNLAEIFSRQTWPQSSKDMEAPADPSIPNNTVAPSTISIFPAPDPASENAGAAEVSPSILDPRIDCIVPMHIHTPLASEKVLTFVHKLRHAGNKPIFIEAQSEAGQWQSVRPDRRYHGLRIAIQLANRFGALNELEFSEFITHVQVIADELEAEIECPDMTDTVKMARELDAFALRCDLQLRLHLASAAAPWAARYLQTMLIEDGLVLLQDGLRFARLDARQSPVFMLQCGKINFLRDNLPHASSRSLTLVLDVPVSDEKNSPFKHLWTYALALSQRLSANLIDDQAQPLSSEGLSEIERQLTTLYATLNEAGLPAGTPLTRRLFSSSG